MTLDPGARLLDGEEVNRSTATGAPLVVVPNSGDTIALTFAQRVIYVNPAAQLAALTIQLPPMPNPGGVVTIGFGQRITALTIQTPDGTLVQATAGNPAAGAEYRYLGAGNWVRWR